MDVSSEFKGVFDRTGEIGLGKFEHGLIKVRVRLDFTSRRSSQRLEPKRLFNGYSHLVKISCN